MQHDAAALRVDRIDGLAVGEAPAKLDHALGEADLPEALVALLPGDGVGGASILGGAVTAAPGPGLGARRGKVDDLVVDRLVGFAESGIVKRQEAELGRHDA